MNILLIGGPRFLGYALTEALLAQNHSVTFFNRGKTNPDLFTGKVEKIIGNRDGEIANIGDKQFDAVIDTCGYVPRIVKQSVDFLKDKATYYVFISSISVYQDSTIINRDESAPVIELEDKTTEDVMGKPQNYGGLKVLCERVVQDGFGSKAVIIRPGLIVGPRDPTNRFTYWPVRVRKGGKTLVPGDEPLKSQVVDVRDLAEFTIKLLEDKKAGVYNVTGPGKPFDLKELFQNLQKITHSDTKFVWASNEWLKKEQVGEWMEMPLWETSPESQALMQVSIARAIQDGLQFRTLEQTVTDTLAWYDDIQGDTKKWPAGLAPEKEKDLLGKLTA